MAALRIRHPEIERSQAVSEFVSGTLASYARARVREQECLRLTILATQKFLNRIETTKENHAS